MSTAIIRRYGFEFADDGNRDSLPILKKGLGVDATVRHRWSADTLSAGPITQWGPAVGSAALLPGGSSTLTAITVADAPAVQFDGVTDYFLPVSTTDGGVDATDTPRTVTLLLNVTALPAATAQIVNFGTGALNVVPSGQIGAWFQQVGGGGSTGNVYNREATAAGAWVAVSVIAVPGGLHEITVGKVHTTDPNWESDPARGVTHLRLGNPAASTPFALADVIVWEEALTRAQRETLADTLPAYYGL